MFIKGQNRPEPGLSDESFWRFEGEIKLTKTKRRDLKFSDDPENQQWCSLVAAWKTQV